MAYKTGVCNLPLHGGSCPRWLFPRMVKLGREISKIIVYEYGQDEFLTRLANPYFFQSLACVLGYDWHSSGASTVTCGALKQAINKENLGIKIAGGKGKTSRNAPNDIIKFGDNFGLSSAKVDKLVYSSKLSAKIDNSCIFDGYKLYHHSFIFTEKNKWCVIQQGMNSINNYARRYHWLSNNIKSFVQEPHNAICGDKKEKNVLNMTSKKSKETRKISVDLIRDDISHLNKYFNKPFQKTLDEFTGNKQEIFTMLPRHVIINMHKRDIATLKKVHDINPQNYEELVAIKGVGAKTIRSLALISDLVYGSKASWKDPVRYAFAFGGKDNVPYKIDRKHYDKSITILKNAVDNAKLNRKDKLNTIKRLRNFF